MSDPSSFGSLAEMSDGSRSAETAPNPQLTLVAQVWRIVKRRKWIILGSLFAGIVLGSIFNLMAERKFTATSTLQIERDDARVLDVESVRGEINPVDQEFYETQYGLLRSRALADRVARKLRLARDPVFRAAYKLDGGDEGEPAAIVSTSRAEIDAETKMVRAILLDAVAIVPEQRSRLVEIAVTTPDPGLSAKIANGWGEGFIESNIASGLNATQFARTYLERELVEMRGRLEASERAAVDYASRNRIFTMGSESSEGETTVSQSITEQNLAALNAELNDAVADRVAAEAAYRAGPTTSGANEQSLVALRQRRAELAAQYQQMLVRFEPAYPAARALAAQIEQLDTSIAGNSRSLRSAATQDLQAQFLAAKRREDALRERVAASTDSLVGERQRGIQYNIFQREADNNRELYNALLQRYKEIGVASGVGKTNVSIVDAAEAPGSASYPRLTLNLLIGAFLGALAGLIFTFIREQIDVSLNEPSEVEEQVGLPMLGALPDVGESSDEALSAALQDRKSDLSDAVLSLRTRLSFATTHGFPRTLSVTSSRPAEGKSSTAIALANSLSAAGRRVILVDFDMRKPSVANFFGLDNGSGVSNALAGDDNVRALIKSVDGFNFDVMTSGPNPPNAAELLASDRLHFLFEHLRREYDHVVCDSPPVIGLADALLLATGCEATLFIARAHTTRVNEIRSALTRLRSVPSHLIGVVLSRYDARHSDYGYAYSYEYGERAKSA